MTAVSLQRLDDIAGYMDGDGNHGFAQDIRNATAEIGRLRDICQTISSGLRGQYATREDMWKLADSAQPETSYRARTLSNDTKADLPADLKAAQAVLDQYHAALTAIEGGSFPGASNFIIAGDWRGAYRELQKIARAALEP